MIKTRKERVDDERKERKTGGNHHTPGIWIPPRAPLCKEAVRAISSGEVLVTTFFPASILFLPPSHTRFSFLFTSLLPSVFLPHVSSFQFITSLSLFLSPSPFLHTSRFPSRYLSRFLHCVTRIYTFLFLLSLSVLSPRQPRLERLLNKMPPYVSLVRLCTLLVFSLLSRKYIHT